MSTTEISNTPLDDIRRAVAETGHAEVFGRWHSRPSHLTASCVDIHTDREVSPDYRSYQAEFDALGQQLVVEGYAVDNHGSSLSVYPQDAPQARRLAMQARLQPGEMVRLNHNLGNEAAVLTEIEPEGWCPARWWGNYEDRNRMTLGWVFEKLVSNLTAPELNRRYRQYGFEVNSKCLWWSDATHAPLISQLAYEHTVNTAEKHGEITLAVYEEEWDRRGNCRMVRSQEIGTFRLHRDPITVTLTIERIEPEPQV